MYTQNPFPSPIIRVNTGYVMWCQKLPPIEILENWSKYLHCGDGDMDEPLGMAGERILSNAKYKESNGDGCETVRTFALFQLWHRFYAWENMVVFVLKCSLSIQFLWGIESKVFMCHIFLKLKFLFEFKRYQYLTSNCCLGGLHIHVLNILWWENYQTIWLVN